MANVIKLRKGLDIHLTGKVKSVQVTPLKSKQYAVVPDSFGGVFRRFLCAKAIVLRLETHCL